ncbi:hypothetical protein [Kineothrix sp. MB12-C1]|uniref:hypothetical protein n=1 Tax=Kineothrix sp. MB12-C1 TaxID=3070215 RepID=UPI0027D2E1B1|nr:hypothetical protein [Kineothrix sp. MB12-C1]WMC93217.1 hypothetical protein RBB56_02725 [Kineothrix sp. MB12-C1]
MSIKFIESYIPIYDEFCLPFSKDECHCLVTKTCPADKNKDNLLNGVDYVTKCKCEVLMQKIIRDGYYDRNEESKIYISLVPCDKFKCKKFRVTNGRHRICAASKLKIPISVYIEEDDYTCTCESYNDY